MLSNNWIYSQRLGDVFMTHDNIGWVVGKDLKNHCVALTKQDMEKPKTSLYKTSVAQRRHNGRSRIPLETPVQSTSL
jgi:hypothetical protein